MKKQIHKFGEERNKFSFAFKYLLVFVFLMVSLPFISFKIQDIVVNQFTILETTELNSDMSRFHQTIDNYNNGFLTILVDYSRWDDSYNYVLSHDSDFIDDNFYWEYTEDVLGVNYAAITDLTGSPIYADSNDVNFGYLEVDGLEIDNYQYLVDLIDLYNSEDISQSFINTEYGPMLLLINPISDTYMELEPNGYMFFGVLFDDEVIESLQAQIETNLSLITSDEHNSIVEYFEQNQAEHSFQIYNDDDVNIYFKLNSLDSGSYYFHIQWVRDIYKTGLEAARIIWLTVLITMIIIVLAAFGFVLSAAYQSRILKEIIIKDYLTGLFNRRYFESKLNTITEHFDFPITIIMGDINGLKLVNDAFGHIQGDSFIKEASSILKNNLKNNGFVARLGGDEFAVVIDGTSNDAEKYINAVDEDAGKCFIEGIMLSISFGFATMNSKDDDIFEVSRSAEDAMYRKKLLEIPSMRSSAIDTILNTLYEKDPSSEEHSRRVSKYAVIIAELMNLSADDKSKIKAAGLVHDIGKIVISTRVLLKLGSLTHEEYENIKHHPEIGFRILNSISGLREISNIILSHHERWDGSGYPQKLIGNKIPLFARIIAIADSFDAMTSERLYKNVLNNEEALEELKRCSGTQFDPEIIELISQNEFVILETLREEILPTENIKNDD